MNKGVFKPLTLIKRNAWANLYHGLHLNIGYGGVEYPEDVWAVQTIDDKLDGPDHYHYGPKHLVYDLFNRKISVEEFYDL